MSKLQPAQARLPFFGSVEIGTTRAMKLLGYTSRVSVIKLLEEGSIEGYQLTDGGWWRISYDSLVRFLQLRKGIIPDAEKNAVGAGNGQ